MDRDLSRWALRMGRYGGIAILYFSAVGMVTAFDTRNLVGIQVTLGKILVWTPPLLVGYLAARPRRRAEGEVALEPRQVALTGVLAGLAAGVLVAIAVIVVELIGVDVVRNVLIAVSQELIDILTFHMAVGVGLVLFVVMTIFLGTLGASLRLIPPLPRRMVVGGVVAVVFMGLLQRIIPTALHELHIQSDWLYDPILGGLTKIGAVLTFVVTAGVIYVVGRFGGAMRAKVGVGRRRGTQRGQDRGVARPRRGAHRHPATGRLDRVGRPRLRRHRPDARPRAEHHRRERRPAAPRVRRLLHDRRLHDGAY